MSRECITARLWLAKCVLDMEIHLKLPPLEVAHVLATQLKQTIDKTLFEEGQLDKD